MKIAINGFGRIGKTFLRALLLDSQASQKVAVAAINIGPACKEMVATLFTYDSIMGTFPKRTLYRDGMLIIEGFDPIHILTECDPKKINWAHHDITWVVEASGCFVRRSDAMQHLTSGARKVLITAPGNDEDVTIIPGVNDNAYDDTKHRIVSLGSCTTNCFAPMVRVIHESFHINSGLMTTIHSYTNDQVLIDRDHRDPRRARAAACNIIPTKTGANHIIAKLYPELDGCIKARAIRVPTPVVSLVDFSFVTKKNLSREALNGAFKKASEGPIRGIIGFCDQELVSSDFRQSNYSCIIDSLITEVVGNHGKVFGWYDNEWGYSQRLKDFLLHKR